MAKASKEDIQSFSVINYALAKSNTRKQLGNFYTKSEIDEMIAGGTVPATEEEINAIINGMYS